jgi:hypothetical protein
MSVHLLQSHIDEAIVWLKKSRSAVPAAPSTPSRLVAGLCPRKRKQARRRTR